MTQICIPQQQQAIRITAAGGLEMPRHATVPVPVPGPGDVLIVAAAAGVNRHGCNQRRAAPDYGPNPVPGLDVAGTLVALGSDVPRSRLGEPAAALTQDGGYARYVTTLSPLALPAPQSLAWSISYLFISDAIQIWKGEISGD